MLEVLKEQKTLAELAQKHEVTPHQITIWKKNFLNGAETVFVSDEKDKKIDAELEKNQIYTLKMIKITTFLYFRNEKHITFFNSKINRLLGYEIIYFLFK